MFTKKMLGPIIKKKKALFIAMILIVIVSSFLSTGFSTAYFSFKKNTQSFINKYQYPDITLITENSFKDEDVKEIKDIEGVETYSPRSYFYKATYLARTYKTIKMTSYNDSTFTKFYVLDSDDPSTQYLNVCVDFVFAKNNNLRVGNKIKLYGEAGESGTTIFIQKIVGTTETILPMIQYGFEVDKYNFGFMFASETDLKSSKGFPSDYKLNELTIKLKNGYSQNVVSNNIKSLLAAKGITIKETILKDSSLTIKYINSVVEQFATTAIVVPLVFVVITLLLLALFQYEISKSLTREMGILNALGVKKRNLFNLLLRFNLRVTAIGGVIGVLGGFGFANIIYNICKYTYAMPVGMANFNIIVSIVVFAAFILLAILTSLLTIFSIKKLSPKEAMINKMDSAKPLPKFVDNITKRSTSLNLACNSMHKNKTRLVISLFAILMSTGISYCALSYSQSINYYINELTNRMNYDAQIFSLSNDPTEIEKLKKSLNDYIDKSEYLYSNTLTFTFNGKTVESTVCGIDAHSTLVNIPGNLKPSGEGIILESSHANAVGAKVGDKITVKINSSKSKELRIDAISNICAEKYNYMSLEAYEKFFMDENADIYGFKSLLIDSKEGKKNDIYITSIENNGIPLYTNEVIQTYTSGSRLLMIVSYVCVGISLSVAFLTIFIMCLSSLEEQKRKLSTLRVIGFKTKNTYSIFKIEMLVYFLVGIAPGIGLGIGLSYLVSAISSGPKYTLPVLMIWWIFLVTIAFVLLVLILNLRIEKSKIENWDIATNTRSKE